MNSYEKRTIYGTLLVYKVLSNYSMVSFIPWQGSDRYMLSSKKILTSRLGLYFVAQPTYYSRISFYKGPAAQWCGSKSPGHDDYYVIETPGNFYNFFLLRKSQLKNRVTLVNHKRLVPRRGTRNSVPRPNSAPKESCRE